jgi:hypothetical protein
LPRDFRIVATTFGPTPHQVPALLHARAAPRGTGVDGARVRALKGPATGRGPGPQVQSHGCGGGLAISAVPLLRRFGGWGVQVFGGAGAWVGLPLACTG